MMKIITTTALVLSFLVAGSVAAASVTTVPGSWTFNTPSAITFSCGSGLYPHTLDTAVMDMNGDFTGTGYYNPNNGYTWDINGNVTGNDMTFTLVYTGNNSGYTLNGVGVIGSDGSITGTTDGNCQTFSMPADSASHFVGNHGQYVSSQDNKQVAAQSRVGMPTNSKGHTK